MNHTFNFVSWEERQLLARDAQHDPTTPQTRFVGEGTNRFQNRFASFRSALGFDALVFVEEVETFDQFERRHFVTSPSSAAISAFIVIGSHSMERVQPSTS